VSLFALASAVNRRSLVTANGRLTGLAGGVLGVTAASVIEYRTVLELRLLIPVSETAGAIGVSDRTTVRAQPPTSTGFHSVTRTAGR
jgi:hypothetical protein